MDAESRQADVFVACVAAAAVFALLPTKALAYLGGFAVLGVLAQTPRHRVGVSFRVIALLLAYLAWLSFVAIVDDHLQLLNGLIAIVTWSGVAASWIVGSLSAGIHWETFAERVARLLRIALYVQLPLAAAQLIYGWIERGTLDGATGDYVEGTVGPSLQSDLSLSNPIFAVFLVTVATFLLIIGRRRSDRIAGLVALIVLVLSSVVHVLVFFAAGYAVAASSLLVLRGSRRRSLVKGGAAAVVAGLMFLATQQGNARLVPRFAVSAFSSDFPRGEVTQDYMEEFASVRPLRAVTIGMGPGQFSSRAALVTSGDYFDASLPLPEQPPKYYADIVRPVWLESRGATFIGSTHQPFYQWLSAVAEFGALLTLAGVVYVSAIAAAAMRRARKSEDTAEQQRLIFGAGMILSLVLLGAQENYWEVPQAVLLPGILAAISTASIWAKTESIAR